jgi:hypothetical protein
VFKGGRFFDADDDDKEYGDELKCFLIDLHPGERLLGMKAAFYYKKSLNGLLIDPIFILGRLE